MFDKFFVNFDKFIPNFVPRILRGARLLAYLHAGVRPLKTLNSLFLEFINGVSEFLNHNSQKNLFEKRLNDLFDNDLRRIYITDEIVDILVYFFKKSELEDDPKLFLQGEEQYETYLYNLSEGLSLIAFIIHVPNDVPDADIIIENIAKEYVTSGKQFTIQRF